jgi:hypothetical protein
MYVGIGIVVEQLFSRNICFEFSVFVFAVHINRTLCTSIRGKKALKC